MELKKQRISYSRQYKLDVIQQSYQRNNIKELAEELGLRPELIYRWRREYETSESDSFPGQGVTTDSRHSYPVAPNLLDRQFTVDGIGKVFASDITYLPSRQGWLYLTAVMDLGDRRVIGWALSETMKAKQTSIESWKLARQNRQICEDAIFHSDRGVQYACTAFGNLLLAGKVRQSMSRKGDCWDNAPMESFFKTLKAELGMDQPFENYNHARQVIFEFIEIWYNRKRLHSALGYRTPAEMEELLLKHKPAA